MNDELLLAYFKRGLIPGPSETEEEFLKRAAASLPLHEWASVEPLSSEWGFSIDWMPLVYSTKKLLPWEGAIFWSDHIQLHPKLKTGKFWGYSHTEILHHESVHAARIAFQEPRFEEFLAYSTSSSKWKKYVGPIFTHLWEFPIFVISLMLPWGWPVALFFAVKLLYRQTIFRRARREIPLSILLCLTDQEIITRRLPSNSMRARLIDLLRN